MILVDFNHTCISVIMQQANQGGSKMELNENMIRHMVLNSLRSYRVKFGKEKYGQMILCADGYNSWRKNIFPNYKHSRKKNRESSDFDWKKLFEILNSIQEEFKQCLPYRFLKLDGAEADDIIAVLTEKFSFSENILIISGDKDFGQLQKFPNVEQWRPVQKNFLKVDNPKLFLQEHILYGDVGDGVPNFLSDDDVFIIKGKRQKPLTSRKIESIMQLDVPVFESKEEKAGYERNKNLIDFSCIPESIKKEILNTYEENVKKGNKQTLYNYFVVKKMKYMLERITEF